MKILLATDGSAGSQTTVESVLHGCWAPGTQIKVVTAVVTHDLLPVPGAMKANEIAQVSKQLVDCAERLMAAHPHVDVTAEMLEGHADEMIVKAAQDFKADLIVMGSKGHSGFQQFLMGSVSHAVLRSSPVPVRIVRHSEIARAERHGVLIAINVWEHWEDPIDHVLQFSWPKDARFECVTVLSDDYRYQSSEPVEVYNELLLRNAELKVKAARILEAAVARIIRCTGETATYKILEGSASEQIIDEAEEWMADLIVMGSHGRNLVERVFVGSVSEAVCSHAHCAVEVLRTTTKSPGKTHAPIPVKH